MMNVMNVILPFLLVACSLPSWSSAGCGNRCGTSWEDANTNCRQACSVDENPPVECPEGFFCWSDLESSPCVGLQTEACGKRCGTNWEQADKECGMDCSKNILCGPNTFCWEGLSVAPCLDKNHAKQSSPDSTLVSNGEKTLVVYNVKDDDDEFWNNFLHFVRTGLAPGPEDEPHDTHFIFIVQAQDPAKVDYGKLPALPDNAQFVFNKHDCYTWGNYGWLLKSGQVHFDKFSHFIFIDGSVRGPYLPLYAKGFVDWKDIFLDQISKDVKLVGSTISCVNETTSDGDGGNPYVQAYAVATDLKGLTILLDNSEVFECHQNQETARVKADIASSLVILDAGYNIASLQLKYRGVDFRDPKNWGCNGGLDPTKDNLYDGVNTNIFEVMFTNFRHSHKHLNVPPVLKAVQLDMAVLAAKGGQRMLEVTHREAAHDTASRQVCVSQMRGLKSCFDAPRYRAMYPEYARLNDEETWKQYVAMDQFESRDAQIKCDEEPVPITLQYPPMSHGMHNFMKG